MAIYSQAQLVTLNEIAASSPDIFISPDISSSMAKLDTLAAVNAYRQMQSANLLVLTSDNANLVIGLGSNSLPQLFGAIPFEYINNIGYGSLFDITDNRLKSYLPNNNSNVFIEIVEQASLYATQANDILLSINNSLPITPNQNSGGLGAIGGYQNINLIGNRFAQLGNLLKFSSPNGGFSAASIFLDILLNNDTTIGNLHINFYGQQIVDPTTGAYLTVNQKLLTYIVNNPTSTIDATLTTSASYPVVALNPLEIPLRELANKALTLTGDLDAVITYLNLGQDVVNTINVFTDCLNISNVLGSTITSDILSEQNLSMTANLTPDIFIPILLNNIKGISNVRSIAQLGQAMQEVSLPIITIENSVYSLNGNINTANILSNLGVATANITLQVEDVLGNSNIVSVINNTITGLESIIAINNLNDLPNIISNTSNLSSALINGITGNVYLSNGTSYDNINSLVANAVPLIEEESSNVKIIVGSINFSEYNALAKSHNDSINYLHLANINISDISNSNISITTTAAFLQSLPQLINNNSTGELAFLQSYINNNGLGGSSLTASITEAQNQSTLSKYGILLQTSMN